MRPDLFPGPCSPPRFHCLNCAAGPHNAHVRYHTDVPHANVSAPTVEALKVRQRRGHRTRPQALSK
eukprot:359094-Chlamydomonas_euryale.AAC.11